MSRPFLYRSFNVATVRPQAVLLLGSPSVSQYEIDVYLSLWKRYNQHPANSIVGGCSNNRLSTSSSSSNSVDLYPPLRPPPVPFVCTDGSWRRLVGKRSGSCTGGGGGSPPALEDTDQFPFHISCGDMDSQPSENRIDGLVFSSPPPRVATSTINELTNEQVGVLQRYIRGSYDNDDVDGKRPPFMLVPVTNDQDSTDFDKCLELIRRLSLDGSQSDDGGPPLVVVVGASGGRFDHSMGVIASILRCRDSLRVVLHDSSNTIFCCAQHGVTEFRHDPELDGRLCGVLVFGESTAAVKTTGLKYNLGDPSLSTGFLAPCLSTSNSILSQEGSTTVSGGSPPCVTIDTTSLPDGGTRSAVVFTVEKAADCLPI